MKHWQREWCPIHPILKKSGQGATLPAGLTLIYLSELSWPPAAENQTEQYDGILLEPGFSDFRFLCPGLP